MCFIFYARFVIFYIHLVVIIIPDTKGSRSLNLDTWNMARVKFELIDRQQCFYICRNRII